MSNRFSFLQVNVFPGFLFLLIFLETALHTFWRNSLGDYTSPVVLMGISILIAIVYFLLFYNRSDGHKKVDGRIRIQILEQRNHWWLWILFLAGMGVNILLLLNVFAIYPIDIKFSDVIPVTMRYVENFVNGKTVYATMQFEGYERYPKYFPFRWLPYVVPYSLKFDPRWMAFGLLVLALFINQIRLFKIENDTPCLVIKSVFPWFCLGVFAWFDKHAFAYSLEAGVAAYYLVFGLSLFSASPLIRSGGLLLVLLSRFSILLWVPLYAVIYFVEHRKKALVAAGLVVAGILVFFVIPFLPFEWSFFKEMVGYFSGHAESELNAWTWQEMRDGKPGKLFNGVGMAGQFYANESMPVSERMELLQKIHLILSAGFVVIMGGIYFIIRKKIGMNHFLLASAKLYLVIFYSFIYVPYTYLFLVPVCFSFLLLSNINFPNFKFIKT